MTAQDTAAIVKGIAPVILQVVSSAVAPLQIKIAALEAQLAGVRDGRDGKDGQDGKDGRDAELVSKEDILDCILTNAGGLDGIVRDYLIANPPKDGAKGEPGINGKDGEPGIAGKDGIGLAGTLINKDGSLVVTLSDGTIHELGPVVGRDGEKGADGVGIQGEPGLNGKDGTLENIYPVLEERSLFFRFKSDDKLVPGWAVKLPMLIDRGVWSRDKAYEIGDVLSYGGSAWICKQDCQAQQPGTDAGADFWRLAVKRGNDGKPGTKGLDGKDGLTGPPGRDGTRTY